MLSIILFLVYLSGAFAFAAYIPELGIFWWKAKPIYHIYVMHLFAAAIYGEMLLYRAYKISSGIKKNQILYLFWASALGFACGATGFLPIYFPILPLGFLLFYVYPLIILYAMVRYRLMDVRIIIRKGLAYSISIAIFTALYLIFILFLGQLLQTRVGYDPFIVGGVFIFVFAFAFQPLKDRIQDFIDNRFYKSKYSYQNMLKHLSQYAVSVIELDKLLKLVSGKVKDIMKLEGAAILIEEKDLVGNSALVKLLNKEQAAVDAEELAHRLESEKRDDLAQAHAEMQKLGAALCIPLFFEEKLIGLFNLGNKLSQDMFTDEDIDLLTTLANQLAIAIENARLHEANLAAQKQLLQADKLSSLGRIAAGMAHEIKNPLAAIKGMTQAIDKNINDPEFLADLQRVVPKEIDRLDGLVDGMIQLGKPPRLIMAPVRLNELIEHDLKLFEHRCRAHQVTIVKELGQLPEINADPQQLTQVITNLILNAIQAMPNGGKLKLSTSATADAVVLEIADTGRGIPAEKLKDIFEPFFTTREEGLGLGLAITYQIIKSHKGEITVESQPGEGTTFQIKLPL
jgi:signal transduction histidine kinase